MDNVTNSDLQQLLAMTPRTPENAGIVNALETLLSAKSIVRKPFTYSTNFSNAVLTAGATITNNISIQSDAPFLIQAQAYSADVAAAGQTESSRIYPLANILLTDSGSGVQLMNQSVPLVQIFGNGENPFILPEPYLLQARGNLTVQVNNRDASQAYNLFVSFIGVKLFAYN